MANGPTTPDNRPRLVGIFERHPGFIADKIEEHAEKVEGMRPTLAKEEGEKLQAERLEKARKDRELAGKLRQIEEKGRID